MVKDRGRELYERINIVAPELGGWTFRTKGQLLHALLHTGNASNLRKLILGSQKDPANGKIYEFGTVDPVTGELDTSAWDAFVARMIEEGVITKEDMDFVQGVWDLFEETKEAAQAAHHEMHGYYFTEIPSVAVRTPWGVYKGGYVPAIYDELMNSDVAKHMTEDMLTTQQTTGMFPTPDQGFTKGRVDYNEPLKLDLTMLPVYLDRVMKFAYLAPTVRSVGRLVLNKEIKSTLESVDGGFVQYALLPWLQRTVNQQIVQPSDNKFDGFWKYLNKAIGAQTMALNIINTAQQFTGLVTAAVVVKKRCLLYTSDAADE